MNICACGDVMKALFFDLDGTLIDIDQREVEVIYDTVNHFGVSVSRTRVKQLCRQMPSYLDVFRKLGLGLTETAEKYWTSTFVKKYQFSVLRKGVESTLKDLSREHALVCVTSRETLAEVIRELRFLRIDRLFKHIVTRDVAAKSFGLSSLPFFPFHEQRRKLYECALGIVKCSPGKVVVIGDMASELRPAKEMGMITIGLITYEARKYELQDTSDFLISNIGQLKTVLSGGPNLPRISSVPKARVRAINEKIREKRVMIKDFEPEDTDEIVEILKVNNQYSFPQVDGPEAMKRIKACNTAVFLVYKANGKVIGVVRGTYDGSRAMIHQLSVHPQHQRKGVGTALVKQIVRRFQQMGAPTVSATIINESLPFWQKAGFKKTNILVVGNW